MALIRVKEGRVWAFEEVGSMYREGYVFKWEGVKQSYDQACKFFTQSLPIAQKNLASCYSFGKGIENQMKMHSNGIFAPLEVVELKPNLVLHRAGLLKGCSLFYSGC